MPPHVVRPDGKEKRGADLLLREVGAEIGNTEFCSPVRVHIDAQADLHQLSPEIPRLDGLLQKKVQGLLNRFLEADPRLPAQQPPGVSDTGLAMKHVLVTRPVVRAALDFAES